MADGALDSGTGEERVLGMALALNRAVDQAEGGAGAHVDGTDGIEEQGGLGLVHERTPKAGSVEGDDGDPPIGGFFKPTVVGPELIAAAGDGDRKMQGIRCFQTVVRPEFRGKLECPT
jgi:hypothetical protein